MRSRKTIERDYYVYTIYDKRSGIVACCGVEDTRDRAERKAIGILNGFSDKKHYGINITKGKNI